MFNATQFRALIVGPTLKGIGLWSSEAENLLVMTMAHESHGGDYIRQLGDGPALGCYQMEKNTFNDIWHRIVPERQGLCLKIMQTCNLGKEPDAEEMEGNLYLATAIARVYYLQVRNPIPEDTLAMSAYAKQYWNTIHGAATASDYLKAYYKFENLPACAPGR